MQDLYINPKLTIPSDYLNISTSRSSGPGGQHVNKLNTRVSVFIDVQNCPYFTENQKHVLLTALKNRIDKQGILQKSKRKHSDENCVLLILRLRVYPNSMSGFFACYKSRLLSFPYSSPRYSDFGGAWGIRDNILEDLK